MEKILHDLHHCKEILKLTSDTLLWLSKEGICIDVLAQEDVWYLKGKNLTGTRLPDIFPDALSAEFRRDLLHTVSSQTKVVREYALPSETGTSHFRCIMQPYANGILCQLRDVTGCSTCQIELDKANRKLSAIEQTALLGHWSYNSQEKALYFSGNTGIMSTSEIRRMLLETYLNFVIPEDRESLIEWLESKLKGRNGPSIDYRILFNHQIHYVRINSYLCEVLPDNSVFLEGYIQNITDIQRRRNDINTLTHAVNNATESIFAARRDGTLIFTNRKFRKNHLISDQTDLSGLKIYEIVGDMQSLEDWHQRMQLTESTHSQVYTIQHPLLYNKDVLAFEGTIYKVTTDEGEETLWSFTHDISERIRYEKKLKRLTRMFNHTIDHLPASIVVKDVQNDFRYLYRNRESYNREVSMEDAIGKNDFDFYPPEIARVKWQEDIEIATTGKKKHWVVEEKDREGNLVILDKQKIKVETEGLSPLIISIEWDITQLELMKREMKLSKERAEHSDKLKSAFLANMSHEIRTPLNAIVGFSRIISESDSKDERLEYYKIVEANNERLLQLINEILDLSKIESGIVEFTLAPVQLHTLCKEIHDAHIFRCPAGVNLIFEESDPDIRIHSDKNRIFQVFSNLIGNAFKFTREGSIRYGYRQEADTIRFYVTDTGTGISPEKVGKVFDRFVKANHFVQGTGLGLSICKTIVEKLEGSISVTSEVGKGSTFTFTLPYYAPKEMICREQIDLHKETTEEKPFKLLVAEENDQDYEAIRAALADDYEIVRATNGMQVVLTYEETKPDLILTTIHLPDLDGLSATRVIRELTTTLPIVALDVFSDETEEKEVYAAGCTELLRKPFRKEDLQATVRKYIEP